MDTLVFSMATCMAFEVPKLDPLPVMEIFGRYLLSGSGLRMVSKEIIWMIHTVLAGLGPGCRQDRMGQGWQL